MDDYAESRIFALDGAGTGERTAPDWPLREDLFTIDESGTGSATGSASGGAQPAAWFETDEGESAEWEVDSPNEADAAEADAAGGAFEFDHGTWAVAEDQGDEASGYESGLGSAWENLAWGAGENQSSGTVTSSSTVAAGRLVVDRLPQLAAHKGTAPDVILKWNAMRAADPQVVDVVVHLHGYSGRRAQMNIVRDKEPASGLDFTDPSSLTTPGRTTPTLAVLPRGHYFGGRSGAGYSFPALIKPEGLRTLIGDAIARFNDATGARATQGRVIVTAHSGGGAALMAILATNDPDEVFTFDALYSDPTNLITWARRRIAAGSGALRVVYRGGEPTAGNSDRVARAIRSAGGSGRSASFGVDRTRVAHNDIPRRFGWRLLADPTASLPETVARKEAEAGDPVGEAGYGIVGERDSGERDSGERDSGEQWQLVDLEPEAPWSEGAGSAEDYAAEDYAAEGYFGENSWRYQHSEAEGFTEPESEPESQLESGEIGEAESYEWELAIAAAEAEDIGENEAFPSGLSLTVVTGKTGHKEEHWDPHDTGLPLYDTGPAIRTQKLSTNFTVGELVHSGNQYADRARISPALVLALQSIRDRVARSVSINSGYRSWARNVLVYQSMKPPKEPTRSRHCSGQAADIRIAGMSGMEIAKAAIDALGDRIGVGIARGYAHIDVRGEWTAWTYLSGADNTAALSEINAYRAARRGSPGGPAAPAGPAPVVPPSGIPASTPTSDRIAGRVIRGSFTKCATGEQPGARAMAQQWRRLTGRIAGTFNCRKTEAGTPSLHGEGRSIDLHARVDRAPERAQADAYVAWMQANAIELQVAYLIWNGRQWSWARRQEGWRPYGGANKHIDHIHVDLSWEGARTPSPLFAGSVPGLASSGGATPSSVPLGAPSVTPPSGTKPAAPPATGGKAAPAHVIQFARDYRPHAQRSEAETGVPWQVTLGQAALESGWGKRAPRNNFFGIKAKTTIPEADRQLLRTREVMKTATAVFPQVISVTQRPDGRYEYIVMDWFRAYATPAASFTDHGRFLRANKRYQPAFSHTGDPYAFASAVAAAGYATDPNYASVLHGVMRLIERAI